MKRISRACVRCRRHKAKCVLARSGHTVVPPCQKCVQAGVECILATSNRGGFRPRRNGRAPVNGDSGDRSSSSIQNFADEQAASRLADMANLGPELQPEEEDLELSNQPTNISQTSTIEDTFASTDLHSTSDALNILSQIADSESNDVINGQTNPRVFAGKYGTGEFEAAESDLQDYPLVRSGLLTTPQIAKLLERYATIYHSFYPIAPTKALKRVSLGYTARNEPHLLTAMITIGAKDIVNGDQTLQICGQHMQRLISEITAGKRCGVEAVEALLLLAEWEPLCMLPESARIGCGQEDLSAWMHIGLAIRLAYILKLDRTEGSGVIGTGAVSPSRSRLAWAACYLSDRQISVRIGRPFACRGLEPSIIYGRYGFPPVDDQNTGDDDFASVLRARLELTQIFTNVHEVLYCGRGANAQTILCGNYTSWLDDFRGAIAAWNSVWGSLTCSPKVKILLQLSYEYLRLYTNAFAFQAAAVRTLSSIGQSRDNLGMDNVGATGSRPDVRFTYESIDAAKSLLTIINNYLPPGASLSSFPVRFTLYCVNAAVFLYKTWTMNILSGPEKTSIRRLIRDTIKRLREGSIRPSSIEDGYAHLLEVLWRRADERRLTDNNSNETVEDQSQHLIRDQEYVFPSQDGFSWLDLEAIGNFVWGDIPQNEEIEYSNMPQSIETPIREGFDWNDANIFSGNGFARLF